MALKLECPLCKMPFETPASFSGSLSCPRCGASMELLRGRVTGYSKAVPAVSAAQESREAPLLPGQAFAEEASSVSLSGAFSGLLVASLGFFSCEELNFFAPIGLLVACLSLFLGSCYKCSSCGGRLPGRISGVCPHCKRTIVR